MNCAFLGKTEDADAMVVVDSVIRGLDDEVKSFLSSSRLLGCSLKRFTRQHWHMWRSPGSATALGLFT